MVELHPESGWDMSMTQHKIDANKSRLLDNWHPTSFNQILESEPTIDDTPLKDMKPWAVRKYRIKNKSP